MCPVFKKGDPYDSSNYRPLSLLPIISKVLKLLVLQQLHDHLDITPGAIPNEQFAYRRNHSTEDLLTLAINNWQRSMDTGDNQLPRRTPTAPLFVRLSMPQLHQLYVQRLLLFVFRCLHGRASSLFTSYYSLIATDVHRSFVTRGQVIQLLRVPFLPGPSGRSSIAFVGSTTWNSLPADIRACDVRHT